MKLTLIRTDFDPTTTIGQLLVDGKQECFTCEDTVRPAGEEKIFGRTAIPYGTYQVKLTWSNRFKRMMPLVCDVPGFSGIRIHTGNSSADTEGCILVGRTRLSGLSGVGESRIAFNDFYPKLEAAALRGEAIELEIIPERRV